jgi:hypothetical protein
MDKQEVAKILAHTEAKILTKGEPHKFEYAYWICLLDYLGKDDDYLLFSLKVHLRTYEELTNKGG